jgi:hypothetical protein
LRCSCLQALPDWLRSRTQQKPPIRKHGCSRAAFKRAKTPVSISFLRRKGGDWEIKGYTLKLGDRARHAVAITGVVPNAAILGKKEDAKAEAREHDMGEYSMEHGHLVADLRMVEKSVSSNTNYTF